MEIKHRENAHKGSFYVEENNTVLAELTYSYAGRDELIIDQTKISAIQEKEIIKKNLIEAAINYVRQKKLKIVPLCPIAKILIENNPEYLDVLISKKLK